MYNYPLIINKTKLKVFDTFNKENSGLAISICPLLKKFQINAIAMSDSKHVYDIGMEDYDPFGSYIYKSQYDASSTYAEIVINENRCTELNISEQEMLAAIAHEVGHIIFFFLEDKE